MIDFNKSPPLLVVEVVSPSTKADDYRSKRSEYGGLEIPEYWIVDPLESKVTICVLEHQFFDAAEYQGNSLIRSSIFPNFNLTADEILATQPR